MLPRPIDEGKKILYPPLYSIIILYLILNDTA